MERLLAAFLLLGLSFSGYATAECCFEPQDSPFCIQDYSFYIKVGTGVSCSESANVVAPSPPWDQAIQGYNSALGNRGMASFGVGCDFMNLVNLEANISSRSSFKYRKFQTSVAGGASYTREFDLDVTPILFSVSLLGRNFPDLNWNIAGGEVYPLIGVGMGVSRLKITNFRTTGLPATGGSSPFASFSNESQYTLRSNFTYTVLIGFEYSQCDSWAIATGYRWLDAGKFKGPRFLRVDTGAAVDVGGNEWKMRFRSDEWFIEFKIFI